MPTDRQARDKEIDNQSVDEAVKAEQSAVVAESFGSETVVGRSRRASSVDPDDDGTMHNRADAAIAVGVREEVMVGAMRHAGMEPDQRMTRSQARRLVERFLEYVVPQ